MENADNNVESGSIPGEANNSAQRYEETYNIDKAEADDSAPELPSSTDSFIAGMEDLQAARVESARKYQEATARPEYIDILRRASESFLQDKHTFKPGDVVQWESNMRNLMYPEYGCPAVVVHVFPQPELNPDSPIEMANIDDFMCDTVIGFLTGDLDFALSAVDGSRLRPWTS